MTAMGEPAGRTLPAVPAQAGRADADPADVARSAALAERLRLARELHDSVSPTLFAVHARAEAVRRALDAGDVALARDIAQQLAGLTRQATAELRDLLVEMRPGAVALHGGLVPALAGLAATVRGGDGLDVELAADPAAVPAVPLDVAEHLYRIAAEALHNTVKHARATKAVVRVDVQQDALELSVTDDGCGFVGSPRYEDGYGQRTMRERAELCGGTLRVSSAPGRGTRVKVRVPLR